MRPILGSKIDALWTAYLFQDEDGRQRLTVTLPDRAALDKLAESLSRLLAVGKDSP